MSQSIEFCPQCGAKLGGSLVCSQCGLHITPSPPVSSTSATSTTRVNDTWPRIENLVSLAGKFGWILLVLSLVVGLISAIVALVAANAFWGGVIPAELKGTYTGPLVYSILGWIVSLILIIWLIFPFSRQCARKEWSIIVNDVFKIGQYRIPKMIFAGIIALAFSSFWGGLLIAAPAVAIILFGPEPIRWKD